MNKNSKIVIILVVLLIFLNIYLVSMVRNVRKDVDYIKSDVAEIFYKVMR